MADNSIRTPGTGENVRSVDKSAVKTQAVIIDWGGSGAEDLAGGAVGRAAVDAALSGNPVVIGGRASTAVPTAVSTDNDVQAFWLDLNGAQVVRGSVGMVELSINPTIDTAVYADGDRLGAVGTFTAAALASGRSGTIVGASLIDAAQSNFDIELWIFKASPTMVNADNGVFDISDANLLTAGWVATIDFLAANSRFVGAGSRVCPGTWLFGPPAIPFVTSGSANLFGIMKARGIYDAAGTTDLTALLQIIRD